MLYFTIKDFKVKEKRQYEQRKAVLPPAPGSRLEMWEQGHFMVVMMDRDALWVPGGSHPGWNIQ